MNETAEERALSFLGLCMRAGQVVSGQEACVAAIRGGECALALLDAGEKLPILREEGGCASHQVPLYRISPGALGHAIGKPGRMVISVPAGRMADKLLTYFQEH